MFGEKPNGEEAASKAVARYRVAGSTPVLSATFGVLVYRLRRWLVTPEGRVRLPYTPPDFVPL